jgi:1-acyl-sn-glycerol-3-phosphate acyltransferase
LGVLPVKRDNSLPARAKRGARLARARAPRWLPIRRPETTPERLKRRAHELLPAARQLDTPWARSKPAIATREAVLGFVLRPLLNHYTRRRTSGRDKLSRLKAPVILVANHVSHIDTPVILAALPRRFRKRTVVAAAADYFYRNRLIAVAVSLLFNTVPMDRKGGGLGKDASGHVDELLERGWNLLLFPEGTRSRHGGQGRLRRGAAVLAARHHVQIIPIRITGTRAVMPPGRFWPSRLRGNNGAKRHSVDICFGDPITPGENSRDVLRTVERFFKGEPEFEVAEEPLVQTHRTD